jgi:small-conductance mechanosensitive channel
MKTRRPGSILSMLYLAAGILVVKVTAAVVWNYLDYLPPDFRSDFLRDREAYFFGSYQWAFYAHLAAGPVSLLLGLFLVSERVRQRLPELHRRLGRIEGMLVLLVVAPSGLWMAKHAQAGAVAGAGFALLALATAGCVAMGWKTAMQRRLAEHRRWMWRMFLLLCSAVVIRVAGGFATVVGIDAAWWDPMMAWACWLLPLTTYELLRRARPAEPISRRQRETDGVGQSAMGMPDASGRIARAQSLDSGNRLLIGRI